MNVDIHPAAELFPMMDAASFAELKEDIRINGQREWCDLYKGQLLDGRNRWKACEELGVEPLTCELDDADGFDPVVYVVAKNLHRRHLTTNQRAIVGAKVRGLYEAKAKQRQKAAGKSHGRGKKKVVENLPQLNEPTKSRDAAGEAVGVSGKTIDHATTVLESGSHELIAAVELGEVSVSRAASVAKSKPKKEQLKEATKKKPREQKTPFDHMCAWWKKADPAARSRFRLWIDGECS